MISRRALLRAVCRCSSVSSSEGDEGGSRAADSRSKGHVCAAPLSTALVGMPTPLSTTRVLVDG